MARVSDYLYSKASINKIPLNGSWELSPICNFACKMCYVRKTVTQIRNEGKRVKDWTEWLSLAEACRKEGTLYLLLTGGEPFLYPHFKELYMKLHEMGFILSINSNGTMIDEKTVEWLRQMAPSRINITLYGASPETYERICGQRDGYERAVSAILAMKKAGIPVVINASIIPENAEDMEKIIRFGKEHGINTRVTTYMFPPVRRDTEETDSRFSAKTAAEMNIRKLRCQLSEDVFYKKVKQQLAALDSKQETGETLEGDKQYMKCRAGRSSFWVSWDGSMGACGMMSFPVQVNPFEKPFRDCWMELTEKVRNIPVLEKCTNCPKKEICNPCAGMLYAECGDVNGKADYMCEMADEEIRIMREELKKGESNEQK